jgi:signal transduction histidine kinase
MLRKLGRRSVLRVGYAAVIGVLILSALEAYYIQITVSQRQADIFRHYVEEEQGLTVLRRNLWLEGIYVRDFFIRTTPAQAKVLAGQLDDLENENRRVFGQLARISPQQAEFPKLNRKLSEFTALLKEVSSTMLHTSNDAQYDFIQREVVPRRGELYQALIALSGADQQRLQDDENRFSDSRHEGGQRLLLMLGLSVLLSVLVAAVSIRHSDNLADTAEKHYAEVEQARGELQRLSARLLEVEEEGRRQLARELHDEIGQSLALLQIEIARAQSAVSSAQTAGLPERLERARALAMETVQTIRNISVLLRPALLDDLGLAPALQFQVEHFLRRSGIACEYVEENVSDQLPDAVKTCVYRVVQEALHNCEKHSGASRVRVAVRQYPGLLQVEVNDDGRGFALNEKGMPSKTTGLGLLGIRERTVIVRGALEIDSAPGRGTRLSLRIPIPDVRVSPSTPVGSHEVTA